MRAVADAERARERFDVDEQRDRRSAQLRRLHGGLHRGHDRRGAATSACRARSQPRAHVRARAHEPIDVRHPRFELGPVLEREPDHHDRAADREIARRDESRSVERFTRNGGKACGVHARNVPAWYE